MTDSRRPRAYYAAHTYEAQRRALALDFRDGHTVEVQRLCRSGKTALIMLERGRRQTHPAARTSVGQADISRAASAHQSRDSAPKSRQ